MSQLKKLLKLKVIIKVRKTEFKLSTKNLKTVKKFLIHSKENRGHFIKILVNCKMKTLAMKNNKNRGYLEQRLN